MKIGVFDSGLGGLIILWAIRKFLPQYDYVYLGDTKRVPYGNRSQNTVFRFTREAVDYLFRKENCALVIVACNTSSAKALRKIQQEYLLKNFSDRRVLGVLIPAAEDAAKYSKIGILATKGTVKSGTFPIEIKKVNRKVPALNSRGSSTKVGTKIWQTPAPRLVSLAEAGEYHLAGVYIKKYLAPLVAKKIEVLVLGCTHYPLFKKEFKKVLPKNIKIVSQDEIIPKKLKIYLGNHPEINKKLSRNKKMKILVTKKTNKWTLWQKSGSLVRRQN